MKRFWLSVLIVITFVLLSTCSNPSNGGDELVSFVMIDVPVPSGGITFPTGTDDNGSSTVESAYEIGATEVTYELWSTVYIWAIGNGYTFANPGQMGDGDSDTILHPVTEVNWRDSMIWCNALTEWHNTQYGTDLRCVYYTLDGIWPVPIRTSTNSTDVSTEAGTEDNPLVDLEATGFRLPTADESELAARYIDDANSDGDILDGNEYYPGNYASGADAVYDAASGAVDYDGNGVVRYSDDVAVFSVTVGSPSDSTAAVQSKAPNALGAYDMSGNVHEWCFDWHPDGVGANRMLRGSSYYLAADDLRIGLQWRNPGPYHVQFDTGFRFCRTAD